jgi:hypothetical protein
LSGAESLRLVELASERNDPERLRRFLSFEADNVAQEILRKQYLAQHYVRMDRPLAALIVLKTVRLSTLGKEPRRSFLLLTAYCYRMLNRFDAAQSTYLHLMSEDGDPATVEQMARANYEKYLIEVTGGAPVLEKVLTI